MSTRCEFKPVKFFCGLIYGREPAAETALARLQEIVSGIDDRSPAIPFAATDYYRREMGEPLLRRFVSFREWLPPGRLAAIKIAALGLEQTLAVAGRRTVNLDPGYLSEANVIIATAKNHYHRVPLADGIYAHMEYVLKDGRIQFLPWTYPDFKTDAYLDFFQRLKERHRKERKEMIRITSGV
jgi:hypothetical protein